MSVWPVVATLMTCQSASYCETLATCYSNGVLRPVVHAIQHAERYLQR